MKTSLKRVLVCFFPIAIALSAMASFGVDRLPPSLLDNTLKRSDIALMPGWEFRELNYAAPLKPSIIAWGEDAIWGIEPRLKNNAAYKKMGLRLQAANVWMLTATKEKLLESEALMGAVCVDIENRKIVPPWQVDVELKGVPNYWGCTNQSAFREQIKQRALDGIRAGADMLHLDDHMGTAASMRVSGGCFCDACITGFRHWLAHKHTVSALQKAGVDNVADFHYGDFLKAKGIETQKHYLNGFRKGNVPLQKDFEAFQNQSIRDLLRELKILAAKEAGRHVPLGINAWNLAPDQLNNAHLADYFSNEIQHYGVESSHPPFFYKLGDALGRPLFATATGEDWTKINSRKESERVRIWLGVAYAFGHQFMYAYRQWAFDEKAGTNWYEPEVEVYKPVTDFVSQNAHLLDDYEPHATLGLLYSNEAMANGDKRVMALAEKLHRNNFQFRILVAGDRYLKHHLLQSDVDGLDHICIVGDTKLSPSQDVVVKAWIASGKASTCEHSGKIPTDAIKVTGAKNVWALLKMKGEKPVLHLLNYNLDNESGEAVLQRDFRVELPVGMAGRVSAANLYERGEGARALEVKVKKGRSMLYIPRLKHWGLVELIPQENNI